MVIDTLLFARSARTMDGRLPALSCTRLCQDLPMEQPGIFEWRLVGRTDAGRSDAARAWLDVRVRGQVRVVCQRCLAPFDLELCVDSTLGLVDDAAQLEAADALETGGCGSETEYLVADPHLDVQALIEDELILVLPYAPRHDVCPGAGAAPDPLDAKRPSPFAALARLRKH
ncbi:YceD family protein [Castellaniella sp. UC4442_H9]|jgi:uncharacterized protein|nr:YceD family protein [Castellaniella sp.]